MYKLIVNADDFGRHELINEAVRIGVEKGCLRSATLMPGGAAFDHAVDIARSHSKLGLGVHFTLVNGNPILPPEAIPSLVDERGKFYDSYGLFVKRYALGEIRAEEVQRELAAQLERMKNIGLPITHCDSHQHIHTLPMITNIVMKLAASAGISRIRVPSTGLFLGGNITEDSICSVIGRAGLRVMAETVRAKSMQLGFRTTDYFAGNVAGRAVNPVDFARIITKMRPGVTELMMHPGTDNSRLQSDCAWLHDFQAELASVSTAPSAELLKNKGVELINFGDI